MTFRILIVLIKSPFYIMYVLPLINMTGVSHGGIGQHHNGSADGEHKEIQVKLWLKPNLH